MGIIFGWGELFVENYSSNEIGIDSSILPDTPITLKQRYFHLFYIPFFSAGKTWYYYSNGYWLKLDSRTETHILPKYWTRNAPWYTFSGIWLLLLIGLGFSVYRTLNISITGNAQQHAYQNTRDKLTRSLKHINTHYFVGLDEKNDNYSLSKIYLKVERIHGEHVTCSIIVPENWIGSTPLCIDSIYKIHKGTFDSISLTKMALLNAIPLMHFSGEDTSSSDIIIEGLHYSVAEIHEHEKPLLTAGPRSYNSEGIFTFSFINQLDKATLIAIEQKKTTNLHWETELPMPLPKGSMTKEQNDAKSTFELRGTGYKADEPYEFILKCLDKDKKPINYLVMGGKNGLEIEEMR